MCERSLADDDMSTQLGLVTRELLESADKCSAEAETRGRVSLTPWSESLSEIAVTIRTHNRATPENLHNVRHLITRVREAEDPFLFYQDLITASADEVGSGLGLARIRAETELTIDFTIEGDTVEIVAHALVHAGGTP